MRHLLTLVLACSASHAGTLSTSVSGSVEQFGFGFGASSLRAGCQQFGASNAACADSAPPLQVSLQANADFGRLTSSASGGAGLMSLDTQSSFTDMLTINADGIPSGFVDYGLQITGFAGPCGVGGTRVQAEQNDLSLLNLFNSCGVNVNVTSAMAPFNSGVPFSLDLAADIDSFTEPGSTIFAFDELQVTLTAISVFDPSGNLVSDGVTVSSGSSTYGGLVTETPEPSTIKLAPPLFLFGLFKVIRARKRVKTGASSLETDVTSRSPIRNRCLAPCASKLAASRSQAVEDFKPGAVDN